VLWTDMLVRVSHHLIAGAYPMEVLLGLVHLIIFIWALLSIWGSAASGLAKLLWTLVVFFFPLIGVIVWFFIGPKKS